MDKDLIRLECLKLAHTHGREIAQVVERAKEYEKFILEHLDEQLGEKPGKSKKQKVDNSSLKN